MPVETNKDQKRSEERKTTTNKYPYEKVLFTQGGTRFVYGDEPGKEFVRMVTPSGTYFEVYPDGKLATFVVGDMKLHGKSGVTFTIDENMDLHVHGHGNIKVGGGAHIEVAGDAGIAVGGDTALVGIGNFNIDVENAYLGIRGNLGMKIEGSTRISTEGDLTIDTGGKSEMITGETALIQSGDTTTMENPKTVVQSGDINLGGEGGQLLHRVGDVDSAGHAAVGSATTVKAV